MARPTVCTNFWIFFEMFRKFLDLKNSFWQLEICFLAFPVVLRNSVPAAVFWYPDNYDRKNRKYSYFSKHYKYCETKKIQCRLNFLSLLSENDNIRYNFVKTDWNKNSGIVEFLEQFLANHKWHTIQWTTANQNSKQI